MFLFRSLVVLAAFASPALADDASSSAPAFVDLAPGVSTFSGPATTVLLVETSAGAIVVDTELPKTSAALVAALDAKTKAPLRYVVNTHWHLDHVGANEALAARGAAIVAHEAAYKRMSEDTYLKHLDRVIPAVPEAARPTVALRDDATLRLGGKQLQLFHVRAAHTDGDLIAYLSDANVLHMGDCFFREMYPIIDTGTGGTVDGLIAALDRGLVLSNDATRVIAGHGGIGTRADLAAARAMLADVRARVASLKARGLDRDATIAAQPTADLDARWGAQWVKPKQIVGSIYDSLP